MVIALIYIIFLRKEYLTSVREASLNICSILELVRCVCKCDDTTLNTLFVFMYYLIYDVYGIDVKPNVTITFINILLADAQLYMTYAPMMDAVSFLIRYDIAQVVSIRNSTFTRSYSAIISDSCYHIWTIVGVLVELRFPFVFQ